MAIFAKKKGIAMILIPNPPLLAFVLIIIFMVMAAGSVGRSLKPKKELTLEERVQRRMKMQQENYDRWQADLKKYEKKKEPEPPVRTELQIPEYYSPNNKVEWAYCEPHVYQVCVSNGKLDRQKTFQAPLIEDVEKDIRDCFLRWSIDEKRES